MREQIAPRVHLPGKPALLPAGASERTEAEMPSSAPCEPRVLSPRPGPGDRAVPRGRLLSRAVLSCSSSRRIPAGRPSSAPLLIPGGAHRKFSHCASRLWLVCSCRARAGRRASRLARAPLPGPCPALPCPAKPRATPRAAWRLPFRGGRRDVPSGLALNRMVCPWLSH